MEARNTNSPEVATWESTLLCNLRCKHCGLSAGNCRPNELDTKESINMLIQLADFGIKNLVISGGEFTVRDDWIELLRFTLSRFKSVRVITNGCLGNDFIPILEQMPNKDRLIISFSLDGTEKIHNARRGKGSFRKIQEILEDLDVIPKTIITTVDKNNFNDLDNILSICLEHHVVLWSIQIALPAGRMRRELFLEKQKLKELADFISESQHMAGNKLIVVPDDCFGYVHPMRENYPWNGCHAGKRLVAILSDGSVTGCPTLEEWICGNIRKSTFREIWESEKMNVLRKIIPSQCKKCQRCLGGCNTVQKLFHKQFCF